MIVRRRKTAGPNVKPLWRSRTRPQTMTAVSRRNGNVCNGHDPRNLPDCMPYISFLVRSRKTSAWCSSLARSFPRTLLAIRTARMVAGANPAVGSFGKWREMTWVERCTPTYTVASVNVVKTPIDGGNNSFSKVKPACSILSFFILPFKPSRPALSSRPHHGGKRGRGDVCLL